MEKMLEEILSNAKFIYRGAESDLYEINFLGRKAILKWRKPKPYRIEALDRYIRKERTIREVTVMLKLRRYGVNVPRVFHILIENNAFIMEKLSGVIVRDTINLENYKWIAKELGRIVAKMHNLNIVHGDLTTSNVILSPDHKLYLIDFGLSAVTTKIEEMAVDLELLYRVLESTHTRIYNEFFEIFKEIYLNNFSYGCDVLREFERIRRMGRYIPKEERVWR